MAPVGGATCGRPRCSSSPPPLVHLAALGALGAGPDAAAGLMAVDLLILVGSSAGASIINRTPPEDEATAFRSVGFLGVFLFGMLFLATWAGVR